MQLDATHIGLDYGKPWSPFVCGFSRVGAYFPDGRPMGVGGLHPRAVLSTYQVVRPAAELWISEAKGAGWHPVRREALESLPHLAAERGTVELAGGVLEMVAEHVFADEDTLLSRFTFRSRGDTVLRFRPAWLGCFRDDSKRYMLPFFPGVSPAARETYAKAAGAGVVGGLRPGRGESDLPGVDVSIERVDGFALSSVAGADPLWAGGRGEKGGGGATHYALLGPERGVTLSPGAEASVTLRTVVRVYEADRSRPRQTKGASIAAAADFDAAAERSRAFVQARLAPPLAENTPAPLRHLTLRARLALVRNGVRGGAGGRFGEDAGCLCTSNDADFSCVFFWDSLFSSVAISTFDAEYARGAMRCAFVGTDERDGSTPERKWNFSVPQRMPQQSPQSPVGSWALAEHLRRHDDTAFLEEMYPRLVRNHAFWERFSDVDGDGLAEYRWSGQVCDNSPLWDEYSNHGNLGGCGWLPPVASVPLNAFLYWDAGHLADLAAKQGLAEDARRWKARCAAINRAIHEVCYVEKERRYWDYNHQTRLHRRVETFYMFWPLVAGMPVPEATAADLIENVLLDPRRFFGAVPFPSVAYSEASYDAGGYWRGRSWPHITYWLLETLVRYGYDKQAQQAADRFLAAYASTPGFPENMPSAATREDAGFLDYNWGSAAFLLVAEGAWRKPIRGGAT